MNDESQTGLARYDAMCRAIEEAHAVDEVKDIRDQAAALEYYARQAGNTQAEWRCCEIRLRAEDKAGFILSERNKPAGNKFRTSDEATLKDLGISRDQSSDWQKIAQLPRDVFEQALRGPDKPTTASLVALVEKRTISPVEPRAIWLCARLRDFNNNFLDRDPRALTETMLPAMRDDVRRYALLVADWLTKVAEAIS